MRAVSALHFQLILLFTMSGMAAEVDAQAIIVGRVEDTGGRGVPYANVQLLNALDSTVVRGTLAEDDGRFMIERLRPGSYILFLSLIGYRNHVSDPFTVDADGVLEIGSVVLIQQAIEMDEVSIEARRLLVEQTGGRLVVNVGSSITLSGSTALDVLERSPGVIVNEQSNTISMLGKDGVRVLIDGRPTHVPQDALVRLLSGISADNIDRIELITSPTAEFDAEGNAGFINIIQKSQEGDGLTGSASSSGGYGAGEVLNAAGDFAYRQGRMRLAGSLSILRDGRKQEFDFRRFLRSDVLVEIPTVSRRDPVRRNVQARLVMDLDLTNQTSAGLLVAGYYDKFRMDAVTAATVLVDGAPETISRSDIDMFNRWQHFMGSLNLVHRTHREDRLSLVADFLHYHNRMPTRNLNTSTDVLSGAVSVGRFGSGKVTPLSILVVGGDYESARSGSWQFRAGVKTAVSRFSNRASFENTVPDAFVDVVDPNLSSRLREDVYAAYGSATYRFPENSSLEVGMRYELTDSNLGSDREENLVDRRFGSLFPTVSFQRTIGDEAQIGASFTRRITRPSFNDLASFTRYDDPYTLFAGNVALQPAITNAVKLDASYNSVVASIQYSWEDSTIAQFQSRVIPGSNVQLIFPTNYSAMRTATALIAAPLAVSGWFSTQNSITAIRQEAQDFRDGVHATVSRTSVRVNATQNVRLPFGFAFEATQFYQSPSLLGTMRYGSMWGVDVGLQRSLPDGRGRLTFAVDDVFDSVEWLWTIGSSADPFSLRNRIDFSHRTFRLTYAVRFGDEGPSRSRSTASEAERARIQQ